MDYSQLRIKTYGHWDLFLHKNQFPYVGRCYAWALREDASKITDMSPVERDELFDVVIPAWDKAVKNQFQHDWPNVAILGNEAPHLHAHLIPRYNSPVTVFGVLFTDPNPKGNYSPYPKKELPLEMLLRIKEELGVHL